MQRVKTIFLVFSLFSSGFAQASKVNWHQTPTAIIHLKQEDDLLGKWIGTDEIENPLEVRWVVTTKKGRGILIFSQNGRLVGKWAGDPEAQQQVDAFEEAVNRLRRSQIAQEEKDPSARHEQNLAFATTRYWIGKLDEQFLFGKYRDSEPSPLDPAYRVMNMRGNDDNRPGPLSPEQLAEREYWEKFHKRQSVKENLLLEDVIFEVFRERVDGVNLVSNPTWVAPHGNPNLTLTFAGEKGSKRSLRAFSQNFITPSSVGVQKVEVWSGTIKVNWGGEPLYTQEVSRAVPRAWFRILFDGKAIMYLDTEGKLMDNRNEKYIGATYSGGMKMLLFVK